MTAFELSRKWFDFAFENKEAKVQHTAIFLWIVELNNRLGWKSEFGLPTHDTMEGLSIGNKNTYLSALRELEKWGFIKIVKESKNQYQANIVSICRIKKDTALRSALDTALIQHSNGTGNGIGVSIDPIDKQLNQETIEQNEILFFIDCELPKVSKMKLPLTLDEAKRLESEFNIEAVKSVLQSMENHAKLKNYESTNLTLRNWIKKVPNHKKQWVSENGLTGEFTLQQDGRLRVYKQGRYDEVQHPDGTWLKTNKFVA